jgi:hypothetical protein
MEHKVRAKSSTSCRSESSNINLVILVEARKLQEKIRKEGDNTMYKMCVVYYIGTVKFHT